jgi:putative ABC transport system permease protein
MALGIGITSAVFSVVDGVLFAPLPYPEPDRLLTIWRQHPALGGGPGVLSAADVADLRRSLTTVRGVEALQANIIPVTVSIQGRTVAANGVRVSPGLFALIGRDPLIGRYITPADTDGVVLSHGFWQREFGGDPSVVGRPVGDGAAAMTVLGVMPPSFTVPSASMLRAPVSFTGASNVDFWVALPPLSAVRERVGSGERVSHLYAALARVADGVSLDLARADIELAWGQIAQASAAVNAGWEVRVVPLHQQTIAPVRVALGLLLGGVALVLLITCVNVAGLLLGRGLSRQRELALRAALGAGRARLLQQGIVESLVLSGLGAGAGLALATWIVPVLVRWAPSSTPRLAEIGVDWRVAAFAAVVAIVSGLAIGLVPAVGASRVQARTALAEGGRGQSIGRRHVRDTLVAAEASLAVVLAVGAALLIRSFIAVLDVDAGFRSDRLLTMAMSVPDHLDTAEKRLEFYRRLFARLEAVPGVESVGGTTRLPLGGANSTTEVAIEGRVPPDGQWPRADLRRAVHRYFETMGITLERGRWFDDGDRFGTEPVAVVNETFTRRVIGGGDALGQRVLMGENSPLRQATIVGVVGDLRHAALDVPPAPEVYLYYLQAPPVAPLLVFRATGDAAALAPAIRAAAREVDPAVSPYNIRTMEDLRSVSVAGRRFVVRLIGSFGVLALLLAAVGVYSVTALSVTERTRELGIHLALGAVPHNLMGTVLRRALVVTGTGAAIGLVVALALSPLMASQLYGIGPRDPLAIGAAAALLLVVAVLAAAVPAIRVLRLDPATTLRCD